VHGQWFSTSTCVVISSYWCYNIRLIKTYAHYLGINWNIICFIIVPLLFEKNTHLKTMGPLRSVKHNVAFIHAYKLVWNLPKGDTTKEKYKILE
jgi:hypothetical protein